MRVALLFGCALCCAAETAGAAALVPQPIDEKNTWEGPQAVAADAKGTAYVVRGDTLEVLRVSRNGKLEPTVQLSPLASAGNDPFIRDAAVSPSGSDWLLLDVGVGPRFFEGGKEVPIVRPEWQAGAVAMPRGDAFIACLPFQLGGENQVDKRFDGTWGLMAGKDDPPLLMKHGSDGWSTFARQAVGLTSADVHQGLARAKFETQVRLSASSKGELYVAYEHAYRIEKFSLAGKLLAEIRLGKGNVEWKERSPQEVKAAGDEIEKQSGARPHLDALRFVAPRVIDGMAVAPDGRVYLLIEATGKDRESRIALDRLDLAAERLERTWVGRPLHLGMRYSMAAAHDGLLVAAFSGDGGRWVLPWDAIESAKWEPVEGALLDGQELQPR